MGVLNITPDSFSDGGTLFRRGRPDMGAVVERAQAMIEAGADVLDIGGESSRPGAQSVPLDQELQRVMPVLERLAEMDTMISIDTVKPDVAAAALRGGCHLVNDIGGGRDVRMRSTLAASEGAYCLMHMQGEPRSMQRAPAYRDVVTEVRDYLATQVAQCCDAGIAAERLLIDPGFGFGKTLQHNLALLAGLGALRSIGVPILVGMSRKRMLGGITGRPTGERLAAGIAVATLAMASGAAMVRSHDVAATADAAAVVTAVAGSTLD